MPSLQTPPDAGWHDWAKLLVPAAFVATVALLWGIIRPGIGRLIFYFLEHDDSRAHFKTYLGQTMPELGVTIAGTSSAVQTLQGIVRGIADTQQSQHTENSRTNEEIKDDLRGVALEMKKFAEMLGRIEGREEARYNRRRTDR